MGFRRNQKAQNKHAAKPKTVDKKNQKDWDKQAKTPKKLKKFKLNEDE